MEEKELTDEMKNELTLAQLVVRIMAMENVLLNLKLVDKDVLVNEIKRITYLIAEEIKKKKIEEQ